MLRLGIFGRGAVGVPPAAPSYGPELWPQPAFDASTNLTLDANWSIAAGVATSNGGSGFITANTPPLTVGVTYLAEVVVSTYNGAGTVWTPYDGTGSGQVTFCTATGVFTKQFVAAGADLMIYSDAFNGAITSASIKAVL